MSPERGPLDLTKSLGRRSSPVLDFVVDLPSLLPHVRHTQLPFFCYQADETKLTGPRSLYQISLASITTPLSCAPVPVQMQMTHCLISSRSVLLVVYTLLVLPPLPLLSHFQCTTSPNNQVERDFPLEYMYRCFSFFIDFLSVCAGGHMFS